MIYKRSEAIISQKIDRGRGRTLYTTSLIIRKIYGNAFAWLIAYDSNDDDKNRNIFFEECR